MDFTLTDEQQLLRDTAAAVMAKECPPSLVRAHVDDRDAVQPLWQHLGEWIALGDRGAPLVDLCLFLHELGAACAPGPFFATAALYRPLAQACGREPAATGTVALAGDDGQWVPNADVAKTAVVDADLAYEILVVGDAGSVAAMAGDGARDAITIVATVDPSRRQYDLDSSAAVALDVHSVDPGALHDWLERATVALAAEMAGTARTLLQMSVGYAKSRVQFDQPIGAFQAIQHKLADMSLVWERAWSAVAYAAMCHDAQDADRHRATHVAKSAAGAAATTCAREGIQVHGGIGYTWEHDLHLFLRRAYASEHLLGTASWHHDRLAELLFG